jgi:ATP-dependent helicase/nuclease subunit A
MPLAGLNTAQAAIKNIAIQKQTDSIDSRIGQAMHRLLERASGQELQTRSFTSSSARAVQREFQITIAQAQQAAQMAQTILRGRAAWAWDENLIVWAGNEIELVAAGQLLRLDRVVQRKDTGQWWVLDYKSSHNPQTQTELREQLKRYVQVFQEAQALQERVQAAFVTAKGECLVL